MPLRARLTTCRMPAALAPWLPQLLDDQIKLNDFGASEYIIQSLAESGWTAPLWHALDADDVLQQLAATREGLGADEAAERLRRHGPNALPPPKRAVPA